MILINWLKRIRAGSGFCGFSASSWNKVCNVLETIEGIGCTINKTHSGNGWTVVVDGKSSDAPYPEGLTPGGGGDVPQWGCSVVSGEASSSLRVRSGSLGWGGAHVAVWPSGDAVSRAVYGDIALAVPVGETWFVVWYTTAAPVPIAACPKNPTQTTEPCAECDGCTVGEPGDPASFVPDRGNVVIVSTLDRQTEWTDMRVLATVECTAEGVYRVVQIQTAEIAVNAIVYPGESGEGEAPTCGHPGNDLDDDHPGDSWGIGSEGSYYTPGGTGHPGDDEGENGATPECGSESTEFDPFGD